MTPKLDSTSVVIGLSNSLVTVMAEHLIFFSPQWRSNIIFSYQETKGWIALVTGKSWMAEFVWVENLSGIPYCEKG